MNSMNSMSVKASMEMPVKPDESDCCNSGCNPCILDVYEEQLKKYKSLLSKSQEKLDYENCIKPASYTLFKLTTVEQHTPATRLFTFEYLKPYKQAENDRSKLKLLYEPGQHFMLKAAYRNRSVAFTKAYTPIPLNAGDLQFTVLVRLYENGQMSKYLKNLQLNDCTLWRGPYGDFKIKYDYHHLLCIAQGTGIAPIFAVINKLIDNEECYTFINLFFCCRKCNEILLHNNLYDLASYWNFKYEIFLTDSEDVVEKFNETIHKRKLERNDVEIFLGSKKDRTLQVLICGSEQFSETVKGYVGAVEGANCDVHVF